MRKKYLENYSQEIQVVFNRRLSKDRFADVNVQFLKNIARKLKCLFDIYDIQHSEMFVIYDVIYDMKGNYWDYKRTFVEYDDYSLLLPNTYYGSLCLSHIVFYITYPEMSYKTALKFHMYLQDIFWTRKNKNLFNEIGLQQNQAIGDDSVFVVLKKHDYYKNFKVNISDIHSLEYWDAFLPIIGNVFGKKVRDEMKGKLENRLNPFTDEWI